MVVQQDRSIGTVAGSALACGVLGVALAWMWYWLIVPSVVLGVAAVWLGWRARRQGHREVAAVAMTLGVLAVLLAPAFVQTSDAGEDWGRSCALDPQHDPNC